MDSRRVDRDGFFDKAMLSLFNRVGQVPWPEVRRGSEQHDIHLVDYFLISVEARENVLFANDNSAGNFFVLLKALE